MPLAKNMLLNFANLYYDVWVIPRSGISGSDVGLAAVAKDISGSSGNTPASASQINTITGVSGAIDGTDYSAAFSAGLFQDSDNPTPAEIQVLLRPKKRCDWVPLSLGSKR